MQILILTQRENLYLPNAIGKVCQAVGSDVACIVTAPAMSTHGGPLKGVVRHLALFGLLDSARMALRIAMAKCRDVVTRPMPQGPFHSIRAVAKAFELPYHHVDGLGSPEFQALIERYEPGLLISMSCPQIIRRKIREQMPLGCINVHGAPLPRYRGLMPAFWALKNGETETATTVHDLAAKLDDGAILKQKAVAIAPDDTWDSLVRKTKSAGADALIETIEEIRQDTVQRRPNPEDEATYFSFPTAADRKAFRAAGRRFL